MNIEDFFTLEDFVGSGSPAENQDAHAILLPQLMLAQDSQQPAGTAVTYEDNGDESFAGHYSSTTADLYGLTPILSAEGYSNIPAR